MLKLGSMCLLAVFATTGSCLAADAVRDTAIPPFGADNSTGWEIDRNFGVDDWLAPPGGGPGPIASDKAHPYVPPWRTGPNFRISDLSNPILQEWVKPGMKKTNDDVLAGKVPFRAHERCWPSGVPGFDTDVIGEPLYIYQRPNEIIVVMQSGPDVRHIYLNVPHSANPKPSWYGESVGHYEGGDTLVIDTIGLSDKTFVDNYRTPHTNKMHVVERWKLAADGNSADISAYVEDPGVFTMPFRGVHRWKRVEDTLEEVPCAENNSQDFVGFTTPIPQAAKPDF